jgi:hypothetical protein
MLDGGPQHSAPHVAMIGNVALLQHRQTVTHRQRSQPAVMPRRCRQARRRGHRTEKGLGVNHRSGGPRMADDVLHVRARVHPRSRHLHDALVEREDELTCWQADESTMGAISVTCVKSYQQIMIRKDRCKGGITQVGMCERVDPCEGGTEVVIGYADRTYRVAHDSMNVAKGSRLS